MLKIATCTGEALRPPYSAGQWMPTQRPAAIFACHSLPQATSSSIDPKGGGVEYRAVAEHEAGHDLIPGLVVGHAVHACEHHFGVPAQRRLDRPGREVLAVDAQPVGVASREVQIAVVVQVSEVAGPVPAETKRPLVRLGVVVVALEGAGAGGVDDLADAVVGVEEAAVAVEAGARPFLAIFVDDLDRGNDLPERACAFLGVAIDGHAALRASICIDDVHTEPTRERVDDLGRTFVAESDPERVVG